MLEIMPGKTKGGLITFKKNNDLGTAGNWVPTIICGSGCCAWDHAVTRVAPAEDRPQCLTFFIRSLGFIEYKFQKQTLMTFRERRVWCSVPYCQQTWGPEKLLRFLSLGEKPVLTKSDSSPGLKGNNPFERIWWKAWDPFSQEVMK